MSQISRLGAFTLLALASTTIMVGCVLIPGLPQIAAHLGVAEYAGWLVTLPSLGVVLSGPFAARLIRKTGSRHALCIGLLAYGLLGMGGQLLQGVPFILAARFLLGGATAVIMAAGTGLISDFYYGAERLKMIAKQGMAIELGGVIFLFVGGLLATLGWRWPFLLYGVAWVFLVMVICFVPSPPVQVNAYAKNASAAPMPPSLKLVYTAALCSMIFFFVAIIKLPVRLAAMQLNEAQIGYFLSFISIVAVAGAASLPRLVARTSEALVLCLAFLSYGCAHATFAFGTTLWHLGIGAVATGIGFGLSVPLVNGMTVDQSPVAQRAQALSYLSMALFSGQFLSSFAELLPGNSMQVFAPVCCAGFLVGLFVFSQRGRFTPEHQCNGA
jgi:MFS family permease